MIQFQISAPASFSIFGEYSSNILRTSIDLRTTLNFQELSSNNIEINFPEINLFHKILFEEFQKFYNNCLKNMEILNEQVRQFTSSYRSDNQRVFLQNFYYMLARIMYEEQLKIIQFRIDLSTKLMIHIFCPASFKVCLAACLLHWTCLQKGIQNTDLEKIYNYAICCENTASVLDIIDTMVCTHGLMIQYEISQGMCKMLNLPNMHILLVDSKQTQDIKTQQQRVRYLMRKFPEIINSIVQNIGSITNMAADILHKNLCTYYDKGLSTEIKYDRFLKQYETLESCTRKSQRLLRMLDVSYYHLDEICAMAQKHRLVGKYTDFGNGRYVYIWYPMNINIDVAPFINELNTRGFDVITTILHCTGVKIE